MFYRISLSLLVLALGSQSAGGLGKKRMQEIRAALEREGAVYKTASDLRSIEKNFGTTLSNQEIHGLIQKFGPVVYFHPKEKYFPDSIEQFSKQAYIECFSEEKKGKKVKRTSLERYDNDIRKNLSGLSNDESKNCVFALFPQAIKEKAFYGKKPEADGAITAPCYVHVFELRPNYYILQFVYFYPYNGPTVGFGKLSLGTHEGDWEHMDVHVEKRNGQWQIAQTHYAAHQQFKGGMYTPGKFIEENGHPVAYAAKYGHASVVRETFLDSNLDTTKKSKYRWDCSQNYEIFAVNGEPLMAHAWWANFKGRWGKTREGFNSSCCNSPTGPLEARWFRRHGEEQTSQFKTYNLIANPDVGVGGVAMASKPKKGTRSFIFESPSRLNHNFCVEFFMEGGEEGKGLPGGLLPWSGNVPDFKIKQKQSLGLQNKTLYRSEEAFEIKKAKKYGRDFKYCFKRPMTTQLKKVSVVWKDNPAPIPLVVKLTGFEF